MILTYSWLYFHSISVLQLSLQCNSREQGLNLLLISVALWCLQAVINALQVLKVLGPALHPALHPTVEGLLPALGGAARHDRAPVRAAAVATAVALAEAEPGTALPHLLRCACMLLLTLLELIFVVSPWNLCAPLTC